MSDKVIPFGPVPMQGPGVDAAREVGLLAPITLPEGVVFNPDFKPCVVYNEEMRLTQMLLEDVMVIWSPWRGVAGMGHAVDLGYDETGKLVGIQIWDDVRRRS